MADAQASHDDVRRASYIASLTQLDVPSYASGQLRIRIDSESVTRTASPELEEGDRRAVALTFAFLDQLLRDGVESDRKQGRYLQGAVELIRVTLERIGPGEPAQSVGVEHPAVAVLRDLQSCDLGACPVCSSFPGKGYVHVHAPGCRLADAIGAPTAPVDAVPSAGDQQQG